MRAGLVALLRAEATISAIVSTRVYISKAPQKAALPYIVIDQQDTDEFNSLDATGALRRMGFVIVCVSAISVQAESLGNAVRVFIDDYAGTAGTFTIAAVMLNGEIGSYEPPADGSDGGYHLVSLDVDIFYQAV